MEWILILLGYLLLGLVLFMAFPHNNEGKFGPFFIVMLSIFLTFVWFTPTLPECMADQRPMRRYIYILIYALFAVILGFYIFYSKDGERKLEPFV